MRSIRTFRPRRWDGGTATAGLLWIVEILQTRTLMEVQKPDWEEEEDECEVDEYYIDCDCAE